jgi:phage protein D
MSQDRTEPTQASLRRALWSLDYEGRDITSDVSAMLIELTYKDESHGKSDDLQLKFENHDGRWNGSWAPAAGDRIVMRFGWAGSPLQPAGRFEVAEVETEGPPDIVTIKCNSAGIKPALRTERTQGYDQQSLAQIAGAVAQRNGLRVVGNVPDLQLGRVTQAGEADLAFLTRLAEESGAVFTVKGDQLVFHDVGALLSADSVLTLTPRDLTRWRWRYKVQDTAASAQVAYNDPVSGRNESATATTASAGLGAQGGRPPTPVGGDVIKPTARVDGPAQAQRMADVQLREANRGKIEGTLEMPGEPRLAAGAKLKAGGFGRNDGDYLIETATHKISRSSGFTTSIEVKSC